MAKDISHITLILLCATLAAFGSSYQSTGYAKGAAAYLELPVHAYAAGLSKATTAWRHGGAGVQYNPAILDAADAITLIGSYTFYSRNDPRSHGGVDGVLPLGDYLVVGASLVSFGIDGFEERLGDGYQVGTFDDRETNVAVGVAGRLQWNIALGARARYLNQRFNGLQTNDGLANGMGFDVGATWEYDSILTVGVSGLNLISRMFWETGTVDKVLAEGRLGVCGMLLQKQLMVELDVAKKLKQPFDVAVGTQYTILDIVSVRAGATTSIHIQDKDYRDPDFSLGVGIRYSYFGFDYGLTILSDPEAPARHAASVVVRFEAWGQ